MTQFSSIDELVKAKAAINISDANADNLDKESEIKFVRKNILVSKNKYDMIRRYGIAHKAYVIEDFGYVIAA